jgi:hypothetical protein
VFWSLDVMAGLVPAIYVFGSIEDVDARDKRGHDEPDSACSSYCSGRGGSLRPIKNPHAATALSPSEISAL